MKYTPFFLDKIRKGDQKSFEQLYHDLYPSLVVFANKYVNDTGVSEDVVQEVFVKLWHNISEINIRISIKSYLYMSVRNSSINYLKKKAIVDKGISESIYMNGTSFDECTMLSQDVYHRIQKEIKEMPKKMQEVMRLSMNNLTIAEIQDELDISNNTVKTHRRIGYARLREKLKHVF